MLKIKEIIGLYEKVQKIPYYCLKERDPDLLLKKRKGSCSEKHLFLGKEFEKLGIPVKYLLIRFDWNDLPIPKEIIKKNESGSIGWHLALKIKPKRKWIYVDATWDPELEKAGFPVTKNWSGLSNTKFAFPPKEIIELEKAPPKQVKRYENREFYDALNKWLESKRKNKNNKEKIKISDINIKKLKNKELIKELPEFYRLKRVIENNDWHNRENVFGHTLTVLEELNKMMKNSKAKIKTYLNQKVDNYKRKDLLFLAALFHDIAKKETLKVNNDTTLCPDHEKSSSRKVKQILNRFDLSMSEKKIIVKIIKNHGLIHPILMPVNKKLNSEYRKFKSKFSNIFLELFLLAAADTVKSYLGSTKPSEFKFRMNFYNKILKSFNAKN